MIMFRYFHYICQQLFAAEDAILTNSENYYEKLHNILYPTLSDEEINYIIETTKIFINESRINNKKIDQN